MARRAWIDHHRHLKEGNESDNHVRGKAAAYLDQAGYELETIENDWPVDEPMPYDETRDYVYTGASFEYRRFPGRVRPDVALPAHHIYGEVGNTPKSAYNGTLLSELDLELFLVPYTRHEVLERFEKHRYSFYHLRP